MMAMSKNIRDFDQERARVKKARAAERAPRRPKPKREAESTQQAAPQQAENAVGTAGGRVVPQSQSQDELPQPIQVTSSMFFDDQAARLALSKEEAKHISLGMVMKRQIYKRPLDKAKAKAEQARNVKFLK